MVVHAMHFDVKGWHQRESMTCHTFEVIKIVTMFAKTEGWGSKDMQEGDVLSDPIIFYLGGFHILLGPPLPAH
jgi:hypothetical protein